MEETDSASAPDRNDRRRRARPSSLISFAPIEGEEGGMPVTVTSVTTDTHENPPDGQLCPRRESSNEKKR